VSRRTPLLCDLMPGGARYSAYELHRAGGTMLLVSRLIEGRLSVDGSTLTVSGPARSVRECGRRCGEPRAQRVIRAGYPLRFGAEGGLVVLPWQHPRPDGGGSPS